MPPELRAGLPFEAPGASTTWGFHATYNGTTNPVPTITCSGPSQGSSSATLSGPRQPLGVNTAAWDTDFLDAAIPGALSAANRFQGSGSGTGATVSCAAT
ncbi:hypothetical protein GCM10023322_72510 [Rugosimonospora acidiphila]|uniref:Uncharacterized protein n=1 Tax=Rugosimonospora acidiphila TaxID=556531 RepID=A0ABP9SMT4_9ACTN